MTKQTNPEVAAAARFIIENAVIIPQHPIRLTATHAGIAFRSKGDSVVIAHGDNRNMTPAEASLFLRRVRRELQKVDIKSRAH